MINGFYQVAVVLLQDNTKTRRSRQGQAQEFVSFVNGLWQVLGLLLWTWDGSGLSTGPLTIT